MNNDVSLLDFLCQVGVISLEFYNTLTKEGFPSEELSTQLQVLHERGGIDPQLLEQYTEKWKSTPSIHILNSIDPSFIKSLPEKTCRRFQLIAFGEEDGFLCIAMANPFDERAVSMIEQRIQTPYRLYVAKTDDLLDAINRYFRQTESIERFAKTAKGVLKADQLTEFTSDGIDRLDTKASVVNLVDHLLQDALQCKATDIHIEANFHHLVYYYRMGHQSSETITLPLEIADMLVQRLIVLGDGDVAQKQLPQDLGFSFKKQGTDEIVSVRLSVLFTFSGYSVVMRVLLSQAETIPLNVLLQDKETYEVATDFLSSEHGMMLVTGPTSSGKTTLLYSLIKQVHGGEKKIISIEDPVEIQFPHMNQVQVNPDIGLDFSDVIRSSLRQNPDVLMIGEIRDKVTANMAMRSAITGVLVFSTLHTPNTIKTVTRLVDLGVDPFLIGSALRLVLSSRLLKRVCQSCALPPRPLTEEERRLLKSELSDTETFEVVSGAGCTLCNQSGYQGMIMIVEKLFLKSSYQDMIVRGDFDSFLEAANKDLMGCRLADHARKLAAQGVIPVSEYIKLVCDV